jgi:hypothetical protein
VVKERFEPSLTNKQFSVSKSGGLAIANIDTGVGTAGSGLTGTTNLTAQTDQTITTQSDVSMSKTETSDTAFGAFTSNGPLAGEMFPGPPPPREFSKRSNQLLAPKGLSDVAKVYSQGGAEGSLGTGWINRTAAEYVSVVALRFGYPSAIDPTPKGLAIWKSIKLSNSCIDRIEVRDEAIAHAQPIRHFDFVYVFVNLPRSFVTRISAVLSLSTSLGYDQVKRQLWARCNTVEGAIATLALASHIGNGSVSLNYANANDLLDQYLLAANDPYQMTRMYDLLCYNLG